MPESPTPANPFESGARKAIPAVLVYARFERRVLMVHRNGRPGDYHSGKWNGLGGKLEPGESPRQAAHREFREETGVEVPEGSLTFPNFKPHKNEDWLVYVFVADLPAECAHAIGTRNAEGELHWVPADELARLNLWPGDRHFIGFVERDEPFMGTIWYEGERVINRWVQCLGFSPPS